MATLTHPINSDALAVVDVLVYEHLAPRAVQLLTDYLVPTGLQIHYTSPQGQETTGNKNYTNMPTDEKCVIIRLRNTY